MLKRTLPALLLMLLLAAPAQGLDVEQSETAYYISDDAWTYTLVHTVTVSNTAATDAYDIDITVPLMDTALPLYNEKLGEQLLPYPDQVTQDEYGHREAHYHIDAIAGGSQVVLTQKYAVAVYGLSYTFDSTAVADSYEPLELLKNSVYLRSQKGIESTDPKITAFMQQAVAGETNPYRKARALFAAVNLYLAYVDDESLDQSALASLERKTANCAGYTNLYIAALRAAGIPARQLSGYLYMPAKHVSNRYVDQASGAVRLDELAHVWVEFYLPELGWVLADPTFTYTYQSGGVTQKFVKWAYFANIGIDRRYLMFRNDSTVTGEIRYSATGGWLDPQISKISATLIAGKDYLPFNDINGHWAVEAIVSCVEQELFNGVSASRFCPDQPVSRAMFVTVLGRLYEARGGQTIPYSSDITQFIDIRQDDYYAKYLGWALDGQLIEGYGGGRFGPDDPITREQMAKIATDFLAMLEIDTAVEKKNLPAFKDIGAVSDWALPGVSYCAKSGVITGQPDGSFQPEKNATRAQTAVILMRLSAALGGLASSQIQ